MSGHSAPFLSKRHQWCSVPCLQQRKCALCSHRCAWYLLISLLVSRFLALVFTLDTGIHCVISNLQTKIFVPWSQPAGYITSKANIPDPGYLMLSCFLFPTPIGPSRNENLGFCISLSLSVSMMNACLAIYTTLLGNRVSLLAQCSVLRQRKMVFWHDILIPRLSV